MSTPRPHLRLPLVAFAAIVGFVSMVGEASARGGSGGVDRAKSCCVATDSPDHSCCCCASKSADSSGTVTTERRLVAPVAEIELSSTAGNSCECRLNVPADAASNPVSRSMERRSDCGVERFAEASAASLRSASMVRFVSLQSCPPRSPLAFLTSRLLI